MLFKPIDLCRLFTFLIRLFLKVLDLWEERLADVKQNKYIVTCPVVDWTTLFLEQGIFYEWRKGTGLKVPINGLFAQIPPLLFFPPLYPLLIFLIAFIGNHFKLNSPCFHTFQRKKREFQSLLSVPFFSKLVVFLCSYYPDCRKECF